MIRCSTGKKVYETLQTAEDALIDAYVKFNRGPIAVYKCDDCGYYHLTSKGAMNKKLSSHLAAGKIKQQQDANAWLDRLKKRRE